ncbi:MAG: Ig-like domain-containing protein, partial [Opitutales bacterium]|nr:Ig-like domain-containing protein [Opitutales bacterium]
KELCFRAGLFKMGYAVQVIFVFYGYAHEDVVGPRELFAHDTGKLTVQKAPSYLYAYPRTGRQGATVTLMSYLRRLPDYAKLGGKTIDYTLDGSAIGSAVTGADGIANLTYAIPATLSIANHTIGTSFAGDISYDPSASTGILKMIP